MSSFPIPDQEGASPEEGHGFWSLHSGAGWGQHPESWRLLWVGQEEGGVRADSLPLPKPRKEGRGHTSLSEGLPFPLLCPSALETRSPDPKKIDQNPAESRRARCLKPERMKRGGHASYLSSRAGYSRGRFLPGSRVPSLLWDRPTRSRPLGSGSLASLCLSTPSFPSQLQQMG